VLLLVGMVSTVFVREVDLDQNFNVGEQLPSGLADFGNDQDPPFPSLTYEVKHQRRNSVIETLEKCEPYART
jgi:hypothetical protein